MLLREGLLVRPLHSTLLVHHASLAIHVSEARPARFAPRAQRADPSLCYCRGEQCMLWVAGPGLKRKGSTSCTVLSIHGGCSTPCLAGVEAMGFAAVLQSCNQSMQAKRQVKRHGQESIPLVLHCAMSCVQLSLWCADLAAALWLQLGGGEAMICFWNCRLKLHFGGSIDLLLVQAGFGAPAGLC